MSDVSKKKRLACAMIAATAVATGVALAAVPAEVIKTRQQGLKDMGAALKSIRDELKVTPDIEKIKAASAKIQKTADDMAAWFPKGSGPEVGVKTGAKPDIWNDPQGFAAARQGLVDSSAKLSDAAKSGDAEAIGAAFKGVGKSCGGCHDKFRLKED